MIGFAIFCIQIFFVQYAFSQTVATPAAINNPLPANFGPNMPALAPQTIPGPNIGLNNPNIGLANPGLSAPMLAGAMPAFGPMSPGLGANQLGMMGYPAGFSPLAGYAAAYGGSGTGEVAVAGELPVVGTTAVTGQVPMSGKVQFTGTIPAGGIVTISGQCGCGCSGAYNAPYGAKTGYNNKPYLY